MEVARVGFSPGNMSVNDDLWNIPHQICWMNSCLLVFEVEEMVVIDPMGFLPVMNGKERVESFRGHKHKKRKSKGFIFF